MSQAVIVVQARMASLRLPGKALAKIGARSILGHCLERLRIGGAAPVLVATTTNPEDDPLVAEAESYDVPVLRGPDRDVLARFVMAATVAGTRYVVRATADNPAVDMDAPGRLLTVLRASGAAYASEDGLPCGAAVEALTTDALRRANDLAATADDREHVTTLIRRDRARFASLVVPAPEPLRRPDLRFTVDTPEDLRAMREISARMGHPRVEPALGAIIAAADAARFDARSA